MLLTGKPSKAITGLFAASAPAGAWHRPELGAAATQNKINANKVPATLDFRNVLNAECPPSCLIQLVDTRAARAAPGKSGAGSNAALLFLPALFQRPYLWCAAGSHFPAQSGSGSARALEGRWLGRFFSNSANLSRGSEPYTNQKGHCGKNSELLLRRSPERHQRSRLPSESLSGTNPGSNWWCPCSTWTDYVLLSVGMSRWKLPGSVT